MSRFPSSYPGRRAEDHLPPAWGGRDQRAPAPWGEGAVYGDACPTACPVDVWEADGVVWVDAELPGFSPEQIQIRVDRDVLRIRGSRPCPERAGTPYLRERRYTRIERTLELPVEVDEAGVKARLCNGVLHLEIPEASHPDRRRIPVEVG